MNLCELSMGGGGPAWAGWGIVANASASQNRRSLAMGACSPEIVHSLRLHSLKGS